MSTVRDRVLRPINRARQIMARLGFRRYAVTRRIRTWTVNGAPCRPGTKGAVSTNEDLDFTVSNGAPPKVRMVTEVEIVNSAGRFQQGDLRISRITPVFAGGGYSPSDIVPVILAVNQECCWILTGDEGSFECAPVGGLEWGKAFGYQITVRRKMIGLLGSIP